MAHRIKDTAGLCCPCAEREGCNCGAPCTMVECRTRGGTATLVGFPEFDDPLIPPRKYLTKTLSGTVVTDLWHDAAGTDPVTSTPSANSTSQKPIPGFTAMQVTTADPAPNNYARVSALSWARLTDGRTIVRVSSTFLVTNPPYPGGGWTLTWTTSGGGASSASPYYRGLGNTAQGGNTELWVGRGVIQATLVLHVPGYSSQSFSFRIDGDGASIPMRETLTYSGSSTIDPDTLAQTDDGEVSGEVWDPYAEELVPDSADELGSIDDATTRLASGIFAAAAETATTHSLSGNGATAQFGGYSFWRSVSSSSLADTLSVEDTEANAITRLLAGSGGTWGAWTTVGDGLGATCVPTSCCKSTWEPRGAGEFSFAYQEAQYRVTSTGNTPGWSVTMRVRFYRKLWGAPVESYALFAEETLVRTADIDGKVEATGDVPIEQGYDTYLQACARINT